MGKEYHTYGPPGTGKTTNLASLAQRTADQRGGNRVLIASLTKAAATEIGGRNTGVPEHNVGTLHSLCYHAIGRGQVVANKQIKEWNQEVKSSLRLEQGTDGSLDDLDGVSTKRSSMFELTGDDRLAIANLMRQRMVPMEDWPQAHPDGKYALEFYEKWIEWKGDCDYIDFTDMIEQAVARVPYPPHGTDTLLFDECQDYSRLEATLCRMWAEEAETTVFVGDPDQAIYEWRGADPRIFMDNPVPAERRKVLSQSYRVPRAVRDYAHRWISQVSEREDVSYAAKDSDGALMHSSASSAFPEFGLPEIIEECEAAGEDLMVLGTCSYMLDRAISWCRRYGITFHNPYRRKNGRWNPIRTGGKAVSMVDRLCWFMDSSSLTDIKQVSAWLEPLNTDVLDHGAKTRAKKGECGLDMASLKGLFANDESFARALGGDLEWYADHIRLKEKPKLAYPLAVIDRYAPGGRTGRPADKIAALQRKPNVVMGTCHSVKGGEADRVLLFPDLSKMAWMECEDRGSWDEVYRTFYVGMTRAKKDLYLGERSRRSRAVEWI